MQLRRKWVPPNEPQPLLFFILNSPAIILLIGLVLYPIIYSFWISLHEYNLRQISRVHFIGLDNYFSIISGDQFWDAALNTLIFCAGSISLTVILGTLLALLINEKFPGRGILRAVMLLPWAIPPVVNGLLWQWLLEGQYGLINAILAGLNLINEPYAWLSMPLTAMPVLIIAQVWNHVPFVAVVMLAALQTIPDELYDSSKIDGAGIFQRFRFVTMPWLSHALLLVLVTQTMVAIRTFDIIYVLTGGGPGSATTVIAWLTYVTTFNMNDFGRGNAYAYIIALVTFILSLIYIRMLWLRGEVGR